MESLLIDMRAAGISGLAAMVWPDRRCRVNFTNPLNGRRWLRLLVPDSRHGIRFHRDLVLDRRELGFSFRSNSLGLRGPSAPNASQVVLGTSFAMGLSVDNGDNWYERLLEPGLWFNAAMPVGPLNQIRLLEDIYVGRGDALIYLYHPNVWKTALGYLTADREGRDIFSVMRWKTDRAATWRMIPRWLAKEATKAASGLSLYARIDGGPWYFNAGYCHLDFATNARLFETVGEHFNRLFARFQKVVVLRVPIKEELAAEAQLSPRLTVLAQSYDRFWDAFRARLAPHVTVHALSRRAFDFADFLPFDTHWSARGNETFCRIAAPLLCNAGLAGVIGHG
jgi:hypothetical protein